MKKKKKVKDKRTKHHILPRSRKGKTTYLNMKVVPQSYHRAYHTLFANLTNEEVILYLKDVWFENKPFIPPQVWLQIYKRPI